MVIVEKLVEWRLAGETEVLGENLPQRYFCPSQNPTWPDPGLNPGRRGRKPTTNRMSYGAASRTLAGTRGYSTSRQTYVRSLDSAEEDLKTMGVRNWRRKSRDRDQWTAIIKEAKVNNRRGSQTKLFLPTASVVNAIIFKEILQFLKTKVLKRKETVKSNWSH
jgi:hypothetical protein